MFKKALVSGSISVFIGILVMSVSVAFGAQIPSDGPPGSLVSPTFSGINITPGGSVGTGVIRGVMDEAGQMGSMYIQSNESLLVNLPNGFSKGTYMELHDDGISFGLSDGNISLNANPGNFIVNAKNIKLNSPTEITGNLDVVGGDLTVDGEIDITESIVLTGYGPTHIGRRGGGLVLQGFYEDEYDVSIGTGDNPSSLNLHGNLDVWGDGTANEEVVFHTDVWSMGDMRIDGEIKMTSASDLGTYSLKKGSLTYLSPGSSKNATATCPADHVLISCGNNVLQYNYSQAKFLDYYSGGISSNALYPNLEYDTCIAGFENVENVPLIYVKAVAVCWTPNIWGTGGR